MTTTKGPEGVFQAYLNRQALVSGGFVAPNWTTDGLGFWFAAGGPENRSILRVDLSTGATVPMFDVSAVRTALAAATGHKPPYQGLPFDRFSPMLDGRVCFDYEGRQWHLDPATSRIETRIGVDPFSDALGWKPEVQLTPRTWRRYDYLSVAVEAPEQMSPSREWFASIQDHNILLRATGARGSGHQQLTSDGTSERFWDIEAVRFQLLSGRRVSFRGISPWSPDSLTLFAYRRDLNGVFKLPRLNWLKPFEDVEYLPYAKVGGKLDLVEPFFVDIRSGRTLAVQLEALEDRYIQLLGWHPAGQEACVVVYSRDFKQVEIFAANRHTGAVRRLLNERAHTFVKNQHECLFYGEHGFRMLPDGQGFLWLSSRDGWNHLYRYRFDGTLVSQLTRGDWPIHDICHLGSDGFIYFTASTDLARPYDVHVCRVPLDGGPVEPLTREKGIHGPRFAPGGQAFLDTHSAVDRPTRTELIKCDGTPLCTVSEMDISPLQAIGYRPAEEFTVKAADANTDLWGVLYKPFDFDAAKSYPVIEYIYGGPQSIEAPRFFAIDPAMMTTMNLPWALAQLGYVVVCLDARGTPGRSKAFHEAVYGNFTVGIPDHACAIRQLCQRYPWMDLRRVGITGHSWGGYFSTCALIQEPDVYRAAVSYAPSYGPWDAIYYEPYLDLPQKNRAAYDQAELTRQVSGLKGHLMIVAGTSDCFAIYTAMKMTRALIEKGIDHEFVVVPQAFHQFVGAEDDYLMRKLTGWFDRYVKQRAGG